MSTRLTLLAALTGAYALVAAAVQDVPPEQHPRDCDAWAAETAAQTAAPAPPRDPRIHARAPGACLAGPGYAVK